LVLTQRTIIRCTLVHVSCRRKAEAFVRSRIRRSTGFSRPSTLCVPARYWQLLL
jgi:hypothetical protein